MHDAEGVCATMQPVAASGNPSYTVTLMQTAATSQWNKEESGFTQSHNLRITPDYNSPTKNLSTASHHATQAELPKSHTR